MSDYISREAAIEAIEEINWYKLNDEGRITQGGTSHDKMFLPYTAVEGTLKHLPAADVRPVVRGKWIWDDEGYHCSECFYHAYGETGEVLSGHWHFCPNCGAWMEES